MLEHLLVDGYNVLHAWKGRGRSSEKAGGQTLAMARQTLLRELELAAAWQGIRCTVVFDGAPIEDLLHASSDHLTVRFAGPRDSADTVIERLVCQQRRRSGLVVVTDDRLEGNLVVGWGAQCWSTRLFQTWLRAAQSSHEGAQ